MEGWLMNRYLMSRRGAFAAIGGLLAALSVSGVALAVTDNAFRYSTPKKGHLTLMPAAFTPYNLTSNYSNNGTSLAPTTTNQTCWSAPVNLPHGATMTALAMWYNLRSGEFASIQLLRVNVSNSTLDLIVNESAAVTNGYQRANYPITNAPLQTVDNRFYGYTVHLCLEDDGVGAAPAFYSARLTYTYANAGD
jgi:hypothetical protein